MKKVILLAGFVLLLSGPFLAAPVVVKVLLGSAGSLAGPADAFTAAGGAQPGGAVAAGFALAQVGTPYRWGAELPGYGFDCSGLAQAAWAAAGVRIPRVAQAQHDSVPSVAAGTMLLPGDLVFFGAGPGSVSHVGVAVGNGLMVDAPHTGTSVRVESFPATVGAWWGTDVYLGAGRPGGW